MCLEVGSTFAAWKCLPSTASDMDPNSGLARFLGNNEDPEPSVRMAIVEEAREGQHGWARDTAFDLVVLAVADTEVEAAIALGLVELVVVLGYIHSLCLHLAYFLLAVVKDIRQAVEEAAAASPPGKRKAASSLSGCELGSWEWEEVILMNSWSASGLGVEQRRRYSRRLPLVRSSKHVHTDSDVVLQNVPGYSPPYWQSIMVVPTSPVLPDPAGPPVVETQTRPPTTPRATTRLQI